MQKKCDKDARKIAKASSKLARKAAVWYDTHCNRFEAEHATWNAFKDESRTRIRPIRFADLLEEELRAIKQQEKESIRAYEERSRTLHL